MTYRDPRLALVVGLLGCWACAPEKSPIPTDPNPSVVVLHWFHPTSFYEAAFDPTVDSVTAAPLVASINFRAALGHRLRQLAGIDSRVMAWQGAGNPLAFTPEAGALLGRAMLTSPGARAMPRVSRFVESVDDGRGVTSVTGSPVVANGRLLLRVRVFDAEGVVREDVYAGWPAGTGDLTLAEALERVVRAVEGAAGGRGFGGQPTGYPMVSEESAPDVPFLYARALGAYLEGADFDGWQPDYAVPILRELRRYLFLREGAELDADLDRMMRMYLQVEVLASMNGATVSDDPEWFEQLSAVVMPADPDELIADLAAAFANGWEVEDGSLEPFLWNVARRRFGALTDDLEILFSGYLDGFGGGRTTGDLTALREGLRDRGCFGGATLLFDAGAIRSGRTSDSDWLHRAQLGYVAHLDSVSDVVLRGLLIPRRFSAELPEARRVLLRGEWPGWEYDHGRRADVETLPDVDGFILTAPGVPFRLMHSDGLRDLLRGGSVSIVPASPARLTEPLTFPSGRRVDESLEAMLRDRLEQLEGLDDFVVARDHAIAATRALLGDSEGAVSAILDAHEKRQALLILLEYDAALTAIRDHPEVVGVLDDLYAQARGERALYERLRGLPLTSGTASEILSQCLGH